MSRSWTNTANLNVSDKFFYKGREVVAGGNLNYISPKHCYSAVYAGSDAKVKDETRYQVWVDKIHDIDEEVIHSVDYQTFVFLKPGYYFCKLYALPSFDDSISNRAVIALTKKNDADWQFFQTELNYRYPYVEHCSLPFYVSNTTQEYQFTFVNNTSTSDYDTFKQKFRVYLFQYSSS